MLVKSTACACSSMTTHSNSDTRFLKLLVQWKTFITVFSSFCMLHSKIKICVIEDKQWTIQLLLSIYPKLAWSHCDWFFVILPKATIFSKLLKVQKIILHFCTLWLDRRYSKFKIWQILTQRTLYVLLRFFCGLCQDILKNNMRSIYWLVTKYCMMVF